MIELPKQKLWKSMRALQVEYFWQVYAATKHNIDRTAEILNISRAGAYRYLGGVYDKNIEVVK